MPGLEPIFKMWKFSLTAEHRSTKVEGFVTTSQKIVVVVCCVCKVRSMWYFYHVKEHTRVPCVVTWVVVKERVKNTSHLKKATSDEQIMTLLNGSLSKLLSSRSRNIRPWTFQLPTFESSDRKYWSCKVLSSCNSGVLIVRTTSSISARISRKNVRILSQRQDVNALATWASSMYSAFSASTAVTTFSRKISLNRGWPQCFSMCCWHTVSTVWEPAIVRVYQLPSAEALAASTEAVYQRRSRNDVASLKSASCLSVMKVHCVISQIIATPLISN